MKHLKEYATMVCFYPLPPTIDFWKDSHKWKNSANDSREIIEQMALRQAIRQRGGVLKGEKLMLCLYIADAGDECHESGRPKKVRTLHCSLDKGRK